MSPNVSISAELSQGTMEFRRTSPEAAWMRVRNRTPVFTAPFVPADPLRAVREIALMEVNAHQAVFTQAMLAIIMQLGMSNAEGHHVFADTAVPSALWSVEADKLIVDAEPNYEIEISAPLSAPAKNEDVACLMLRSMEAARLEGLKARYLLLMRQMMGRA